MTRLSLYIARLYVINLITLFVLLFSLVVTVDVIMNLRRFVNAAVELMAERGHESISFATKVGMTAWLVADLWGPRLLQLFSYLSGVAMIAAMGFTCAQLVRHRELVAIMASGLSLHRVVKPFLAVALVMTALQVVNHEVLIPRVAHLLARDAGDSGRRGLDSFRVRLVSDGGNRLLSAARFHPQEQVLDRPTLWERDSSGNVTRTIFADRASWDGGTWILEGGREERIAPGASSVTRGVAQSMDIAIDPEKLVVNQLRGLGQNLSWRQISRIVNSGGIDANARQRLETARWGRLGAIVSNLVALMAALPVFLVRTPQGMLTPALKAAPVALLGLGAAGLSSAVLLPGLPAWIGAFVPALVILPITIAMLTGIRS